jgi:murein DD-endopeptidase MepM/ murein hydrolase activator NlpD
MIRKLLSRLGRLTIPWLFVLIGGIVLMTFIALPVSAQCSMRTDWPTYTVVGGDTLFSIARCSGTTVNVLMQANCLVNANQIFVGQQLRVPSGMASTASPTSSGELPVSPDFSFFTSATYQQFENGFMTWRTDTGAIWVFFNSGRVTSYPLDRYGGLSGDARYMMTLPPGRNLASGGFKKVFDNFQDVRSAMGWAIGGEQSYDMFLEKPSFGRYFTVMLPDKRVVRIDPDGTWRFTTVVPPNPTAIPDQYSTGATFQSFERGFMVWRADTGAIRVYIGGDTGDLTTYSSLDYGLQPIEPISHTHLGPGTRLMPINGFNRVWSNVPGVQERLGWAVSNESSYTMILRGTGTGSAVTSFSLPDGRFVTNIGNNQWAVSGGLPTPLPVTAVPTNPPQSTSAVIRVGATYQPFENGFMTWRSDTGEIRVYIGQRTGTTTGYSPAYYGLFPVSRTGTPPDGRWFPDMGFGKVWSAVPGLRGQLGWATGAEQGYTMILSALPDQVFTFNRPDNCQITVSKPNSWTANCPLPILTPTPPPTSLPSTLRVIAASVNPRAVKVGGSVTISWEVSGASRVELWPFEYSKAGLARLQNPTASNLPGKGTWTYAVPLRGLAVLIFEIDAFDTAGRKMTTRLDSVEVTRVPCVAEPGYQCHTDPVDVQVVYQQFEKGYMLWRADNGTTYVLNTTMVQPWRSYASIQGDGPDITENPPTGMTAPQGELGKLWRNNTAVREQLGWAIGAQQTHTTPIQIMYGDGWSVMENRIWLKWFDGRVVTLVANLQDVTSGPAWMFSPTSASK